MAETTSAGNLTMSAVRRHKETRLILDNPAAPRRAAPAGSIAERSSGLSARPSTPQSSARDESA
jgi:hypothetical protein